MIRYIVSSVSHQLKLERHYPNCGRWGGNIHSSIRYRAVRQVYRQLHAEGMDFEAGDMLKLLELLKVEPRPVKLPEVIEKLVRRYITCRGEVLYQVNQLLQHIERTWQYVSSEPGDRTNNATERLIGLDYKIRVKTMRGLKNQERVLGHCYLSEYLWGSDGICDLWDVV